MKLGQEVLAGEGCEHLVAGRSEVVGGAVDGVFGFESEVEGDDFAHVFGVGLSGAFVGTRGHQAVYFAVLVNFDPAIAVGISRFFLAGETGDELLLPFGDGGDEDDELLMAVAETV